MAKTLTYYLSQIEDFRNQDTQNFRHPLLDILLMSICAIFSGAEDFEEIAEFGKDKQDLLSKFIDFPHGIPSHDTIRRVFLHLDAQNFNRQFMAWVQDCLEGLGLSFRQITIDGKTLRGSKTGIHLVSAVASELGMSLGQVKTAQKSNEITAIPALLDLLIVKGCIVSIDAMGTQHKIIEKILEKKGDYFLALKGNQKELFEQVKEQFLLEQQSCENYQTSAWTGSHNQVVHYQVQTCKDFKWVANKENWQELNALIKISTQSPNRGIEVRYYISSLKDLTPQKAYDLARGHWAVENKLHWQLDVSFKEDQQRHRTGNAPENLSIVRKMVLNTTIIKEQKLSKKKILKKMAWNESYFLEMMKKILHL